MDPRGGALLRDVAAAAAFVAAPSPPAAERRSAGRRAGDPPPGFLPVALHPARPRIPFPLLRELPSLLLSACEMTPIFKVRGNVDSIVSLLVTLSRILDSCTEFLDFKFKIVSFVQSV